MTKYVEVTHWFRVDDDVTEEQINYIVGTMTVQAEEAVAYGDDGEELAISTCDVEAIHNVRKSLEVWIISSVTGITGDGDTSSGGFHWFPVATTDERTAMDSFRQECEAMKGTAAKVRLLKRHVPFLSNFTHDPLDNLQEYTRTRITAWIDDRLEEVEHRYPAEVTKLVFHDEASEEAVFKDLLYLTRKGDDAGFFHYYLPHVDERQAIKERLRRIPPNGGNDLSDALAERFPELVEEVLDEQQAFEQVVTIDPQALRTVIALNEDGVPEHQWNPERSEYLRGQYELMADTDAVTLIKGDELLMDEARAFIAAAAASAHAGGQMWLDRIVAITVTYRGDIPQAHFTYKED